VKVDVHPGLHAVLLLPYGIVEKDKFCIPCISLALSYIMKASVSVTGAGGLDSADQSTRDVPDYVPKYTCNTQKSENTLSSELLATPDRGISP
jgi:hypothetical protein